MGYSHLSGVVTGPTPIWDQVVREHKPSPAPVFEEEKTESPLSTAQLNEYYESQAEKTDSPKKTRKKKNG